MSTKLRLPSKWEAFLLEKPLKPVSAKGLQNAFARELGVYWGQVCILKKSFLLT